MDRREFRRQFGLDPATHSARRNNASAAAAPADTSSSTASGTLYPAVFTVVHVLDPDQALRNAKITAQAGASGVFLINHDFAVAPFLPIIAHVREAMPSLWLGVNFLAVTGRDAFPQLGQLVQHGTAVDAYWADDARIDEHASHDRQTEAAEIAAVRASCGWNGLYFGGTAFKKQREVAPADYAASARAARHWMDVVTTSGVATGHAADTGKISTFRDACGPSAVGLASGVTPENAPQYARDVDAILVATGVNVADDFYNLDAGRLSRLLDVCIEHGGIGEEQTCDK